MKMKEKTFEQLEKEWEEEKKKIKITIVVEHKEKGIVKIPVTIRQAHEAYDFGYMIPPEECEFMDTLKLNKCERTFWAFHQKWAHVVDAMSNHIGYTYNPKTKKMKEVKSNFLHSGKEPKWKKK